MPNATRLRIPLSLTLALLAGCGGDQPASSTGGQPAPDPGGYGYGGYGDYGYGSGEIVFLNDAPANTTLQPDVGLTDLSFTTPDGAVKKVRDHLGPHGAVVVVTRGATDPICPYCSTQTAEYIRDYEQFRARGLEVLLVYPLESIAQGPRLDAFLSHARGKLADSTRPVPFPVVFDVELTAVNRLGIRQDLSKPATYIIDAAGEVRYAYVGAHLADRPSTAAVLKEFDHWNAPASPAAAPPTDLPPADSSTD